MTSNEILPKISKVKDLSNFWLNHRQISNLSWYDKSQLNCNGWLPQIHKSRKSQYHSYVFIKLEVKLHWGNKSKQMFQMMKYNFNYQYFSILETDVLATNGAQPQIFTVKKSNSHWPNLYLQTQLSIYLQSNCLSLVELSSSQLVLIASLWWLL